MHAGPALHSNAKFTDKCTLDPCSGAPACVHSLPACRGWSAFQCARSCVVTSGDCFHACNRTGTGRAAGGQPGLSSDEDAWYEEVWLVEEGAASSGSGDALAVGARPLSGSAEPLRPAEEPRAAEGIRPAVPRQAGPRWTPDRTSRPAARLAPGAVAGGQLRPGRDDAQAAALAWALGGHFQQGWWLGQDNRTEHQENAAQS